MFTRQNLDVSNSGFANARKRRETDLVEAEFDQLNPFGLTFGKWLWRLTSNTLNFQNPGFVWVGF